MQGTMPTLTRSLIRLADRLTHIVQEDISWRRVRLDGTASRVLHAIQLTFEKNPTIGDTNGMRPVR